MVARRQECGTALTRMVEGAPTWRPRRRSPPGSHGRVLRAIIAAMPGFIGLTLSRQIEQPNLYLLLAPIV